MSKVQNLFKFFIIIFLGKSIESDDHINKTSRRQNFAASRFRRAQEIFKSNHVTVLRDKNKPVIDLLLIGRIWRNLWLIL